MSGDFDTAIGVVDGYGIEFTVLEFAGHIARRQLPEVDRENTKFEAHRIRRIYPLNRHSFWYQPGPYMTD